MIYVLQTGETHCLQVEAKLRTTPPTEFEVLGFWCVGALPGPHTEFSEVNMKPWPEQKAPRPRGSVVLRPEIRVT